MAKWMLWIDEGLPTRCVAKETSPWELTVYRQWLPDGVSPPLLGWAGAGGRAWLFLKEADGEHPDWSQPGRAEQVWQAVGRLHRSSQMAPGQTVPGTPRLPLLLREVGPARTLPLLRRLVETMVDPQLRPEALGLLHPDRLVLVHGDLHRENLLLDHGRLLLLDWECSALAHPVWDLLFLDPDGDGWESFPRGEAALRALRAYHASGPLDSLSWGRLTRLRRLAQLLLALFRRSHFSRRAKEAPLPELRDPLWAAAVREGERVERLRRSLLPRSELGQSRRRAK